MILTCDVDGCLADFNTSFAKLISTITQNRIVYPVYDDNFPPCWNWPPEFGAAADEVQRAWIEVENSTLFWAKLSPYTTTHADLEALKIAELNGHTIYFLTRRVGSTAKGQTESWLEQYGFKDPTVIVAKQEKCYFTKCVWGDVVIDDRPEDLIGHGPGVKCYLFDRPYNKQANYFTRVSSFREVLKELKI